MENTMGKIVTTEVVGKKPAKALDRYVFIENVDMEFRTKKGVF